MPVVDAFPGMLRENLETSFEEDIDHVFDVAQVRHALLQQQSQLDLELRRVSQKLHISAWWNNSLVPGMGHKWFVG